MRYIFVTKFFAKKIEALYQIKLALNEFKDLPLHQTQYQQTICQNSKPVKYKSKKLIGSVVLFFFSSDIEMSL